MPYVLDMVLRDPARSASRNVPPCSSGSPCLPRASRGAPKGPNYGPEAFPKPHRASLRRAPIRSPAHVAAADCRGRSLHWACNCLHATITSTLAYRHPPTSYLRRLFFSESLLEARNKNRTIPPIRLVAILLQRVQHRRSIPYWCS